jgi:hypothetical protein
VSKINCNFSKSSGELKKMLDINHPLCYEHNAWDYQLIIQRYWKLKRQMLF